jgi:hypothetical protein
VSWQPFNKFVDRVGVLKRPHLPGTGMWWVQFSGVYVEREREERERQRERERKQEKEGGRYAAVCCGMLRYAAICCGMLQYAAPKSLKDSRKKHER